MIDIDREPFPWLPFSILVAICGCVVGLVMAL